MPDTSVVGRPIVHARFTDRRDGDLFVGLPDDALAPRRAAIAPTPWTWLDQVHGDRVVVVTRPGEHAGAAADAAVTAVPGATLAVHTADCAGVLLVGTSEERTVVGAAHAGWRGAELGVLEAHRRCDARARAPNGSCGGSGRASRRPPTSSAPRTWHAWLHAGGRRWWHAPGRARPHSTCGRRSPPPWAAAGAEPELRDPLDVRCTAADPDCFSWRAGADRGRQAAVTWIEGS